MPKFPWGHHFIRHVWMEIRFVYIPLMRKVGSLFRFPLTLARGRSSPGAIAFATKQGPNTRIVEISIDSYCHSYHLTLGPVKVANSFFPETPW